MFFFSAKPPARDFAMGCMQIPVMQINLFIKAIL